MTQQWKPITSAPKDGSEIWAYNGEQARMRWIEGEGYALWAWAEDLLSDTDPNPEPPTHWMPLPDAPCQTCNDQGAVGNILTAEPCPACTPPASAQDDAKDDFGMSPYCPECNGGGRISVLSDNSPDAHDVDIDCTHCDGSGSAAYAATNLAKALQRERMQHLQMYGEYKNFHRSLCARFGYGHDEVHFRRDLVSLEEAIAAKIAAPAVHDAREVLTDDEILDRWDTHVGDSLITESDKLCFAREIEHDLLSKLSQRDSKDAARYRWLRDQEQTDAIAIIMKNKHIDDSRTCAENIDQFIDAALAASQQQEG